MSLLPLTKKKSKIFSVLITFQSPKIKVDLQTQNMFTSQKLDCFLQTKKTSFFPKYNIDLHKRKKNKSGGWNGETEKSVIFCLSISISSVDNFSSNY